MMNDGPEFIGLAQQIAAGDWASVLTHGFHPLYPFLLRWVEPLTGDWERAGVLISIAAGALAVIALFALLADAFDRRVAAVGALLLAVHPIAIEQADVQSDALYLALFLTSAWALWRALARASAAWALAAGVAAGLAYLTRPEGLGTAAVGLGLAAVALARRHSSVSQAARFAAALTLGLAVSAGPLVAYLSAQTGSLTLTEKKSVASLLSGSAGTKRVRPLDPLLAERPDLLPPARGDSPFRQGADPKGWRRYPAALAQVAGGAMGALRPELAVLLAL
jgi:hypothetical protein